MSRAITVEISDAVYERLQRAADLSRQPIDSLVEQSLAHSLSPLLEDIPPDYQDDVFPLLQMSETELLEEAKRVFPAGKWNEYEALLSKKKERTLTEAEQKRLVTLRREADVLTFRKGYAAVLLKRRGFNPPAIEDLPVAQ